jgi:hypothetical protein
MQPHPVGEPFRSAFVKAEWAVIRGPHFAHKISGDVAKGCDFFDRETFGRQLYVSRFQKPSIDAHGGALIIF